MKSWGFNLYYSFVIIIFIAFCSSCNNSSRLEAHSSDSDAISFIVIGDWGRQGEKYQKDVADQIDIFARKFKAKFIITTGDNFYESGVASINDPQWKTSFENIYNKKGHQLPWFPVLGNHDYRSNPQAQIEYSSISKRWKMPARYYSMETAVGSSDKALFVFTDTSPFAKSYEDRQDTLAQLKWLQKTLLDSDAGWKIVIGHHPIYSSGPHGNTPELVNGFKPILLQSETDFYLSGHDHILEYNIYPKEPLHYLISGGGSLATKVEDTPLNQFTEDSPGFLVMTLSPDEAAFYFYDEDGDLLYEKEVKK